MKYVDWVERVLRASVEAFDAGSGMSTGEREIATELGLERDDIAEALGDAVRDLDRVGLLDVRSRNDIRVRPEARKIRVTTLRTMWPTFAEMWLEERHERFLWTLCKRSEQRAEHMAFVQEVDGDDVLREMGESPNRGDSDTLIRQLEQLSLLDASRMTLGTSPVFPTYGGIVRATEKVTTEGQALVGRLLEDWETTNTDFKRELHLDSNDGKAEFVRDVLALTNTQVTGERYLVTGFDPKSRTYTTTVDPTVTQDRIEDVLNQYTRPPVTLRYATFGWIDGTGDVGLLEVRRDRTKVPHRVKKDLVGARKSVRAGQVFVRHNSHVAEASPEEVADLEAEAARARGET